MANPKLANGELTLEEYEKIFDTMGRPYWCTIGGGEPFLRKDFADIVLALVQRGGPRLVNLSTNGSLTKRTVEGIARIAKSLGSAELIVNMSLDGVGADHDEVRGLPHNFDNLLATVAGIRDLRAPNVAIGINTVISKYNIEKVSGIIDYVVDELRPDSFTVEAAQIRPEFYNETSRPEATPEAIEAVIDKYLRRSREAKSVGLARVKGAFRQLYYKDVKNMVHGRHQHRCFSAFTSCQMTPKGDVWSNAQLADRLGNVRDVGLDFSRLWFSQEADRVRLKIKSAPCKCELSNVMYPNMLMDPLRVAQVALRVVRGNA
jgi:MoaA/NifB/PqqE/SkfB family radical SAM enzyme